MDRRAAIFSTLVIAVLAAASFHVEGAATHCNPDNGYAGNASNATQPTSTPAMESVVSSASTRASDEAPSAVTHKPTEAANEPVRTAGVSTPTSGGGDDSGGLGDGGGGTAGVHKRALHWQSFLPGIIK